MQTNSFSPLLPPFSQTVPPGVPPGVPYPPSPFFPPSYPPPKKGKSKGLIIVGILALVIGIFVVIGIGVGLYFVLRSKTKKNPFFAIVFDGTLESINQKIPYSTKMVSGPAKPYIDEIKTHFGISSIATRSQLNYAVMIDKFQGCFWGLVGDVEDKVFITPYYATQADFDVDKGVNCAGSINNIGKHTVNEGTANAQGFYVYVEDQSKIPNNGDKIKIGNTNYNVSAIFTK